MKDFAIEGLLKTLLPKDGASQKYSTKAFTEMLHYRGAEALRRFVESIFVIRQKFRICVNLHLSCSMR